MALTTSVGRFVDKMSSIRGILIMVTGVSMNGLTWYLAVTKPDSPQTALLLSSMLSILAVVSGNHIAQTAKQEPPPGTSVVSSVTTVTDPAVPGK